MPEWHELRDRGSGTTLISPGDGVCDGRCRHDYGGLSATNRQALEANCLTCYLRPTSHLGTNRLKFVRFVHRFRLLQPLRSFM
jgi:hypothetical protein